MIGKIEHFNTFGDGWVPPENLDKEAINLLPLFQFSGKISLVRTEEEQARALRHLFQADAVGVDTETRPSFRKGVFHKPSLLQISTSDETFIFLLRSTGISGRLAEFFGDPCIIKAGVAISDDIRLLAKLRSFTAQGLVDVAKIARRHNICQQGLRGLVAYFFGVRISKGEQCSNWGRTELTDKQVVYAATDAWMSLAIFRYMERHGLLYSLKCMEPATLKAGSPRRPPKKISRSTPTPPRNPAHKAAAPSTKRTIRPLGM